MGTGKRTSRWLVTDEWHVPDCDVASKVLAAHSAVPAGALAALLDLLPVRVAIFSECAGRVARRDTGPAGAPCIGGIVLRAGHAQCLLCQDAQALDAAFSPQARFQSLAPIPQASSAPDLHARTTLNTRRARIPTPIRCSLLPQAPPRTIDLSDGTGVSLCIHVPRFNDRVEVPLDLALGQVADAVSLFGVTSSRLVLDNRWATVTAHRSSRARRHSHGSSI